MRGVYQRFYDDSCDNTLEKSPGVPTLNQQAALSFWKNCEPRYSAPDMDMVVAPDAVKKNGHDFTAEGPEQTQPRNVPSSTSNARRPWTR